MRLLVDEYLVREYSIYIVIMKTPYFSLRNTVFLARPECVRAKACLKIPKSAKFRMKPL
jgi:hypothetical protein